MKRIGVLLLIAFLASCSTNPVTREDYQAGRKPAHPVFLSLTLPIPGLSQLLHGEYLEALIYFTGSLGSAVLIIPYTEMEGGAIRVKEGREGEAAALAGMAGAFYGLSLIDAVATPLLRRQEWDAIARETAWETHPYFKKLDEIPDSASQEKVRELIGGPDIIRVDYKGDLSYEEWLYHYEDKILNVMFKNKKLVSIAIDQEGWFGEKKGRTNQGPAQY